MYELSRFEDRGQESVIDHCDLDFIEGSKFSRHFERVVKVQLNLAILFTELFGSPVEVKVF